MGKDVNLNSDCISTQTKTYLEDEKEDIPKSKKKKKKKDKESIENYNEGISNVTTTHLEDTEHSHKKKKKDKENIPIEDDGISNITEDLVYDKPKNKKKKKDKAKVQDLSEFISTSNNKLETDE